MINRRDKVCTKIKVHKNVGDRPFGFEIYLVTVKTMRTIAQIFVAFSEKLNFNVDIDLKTLHLAKKKCVKYWPTLKA